MELSARALSLLVNPPAVLETKKVHAANSGPRIQLYFVCFKLISRFLIRRVSSVCAPEKKRRLFSRFLLPPFPPLRLSPTDGRAAHRRSPRGFHLTCTHPPQEEADAAPPVSCRGQPRGGAVLLRSVGR